MRSTRVARRRAKSAARVLGHVVCGPTLFEGGVGLGSLKTRMELRPADILVRGELQRGPYRSYHWCSSLMGVSFRTRVCWTAVAAKLTTNERSSPDAAWTVRSTKGTFVRLRLGNHLDLGRDGSSAGG